MSDSDAHPVFISYSWHDDKPFVERLYADLRSRGIPCFRDDASDDERHLKSRGKTVFEELRDEIAVEYRRFVPVIGPAAFTSQAVQHEWDWARESCLAITPVLRLSKHDDLPSDFKDRLYVDFSDVEPGTRGYEQKLDQLVKLLSDAPAPLAKVHGAIPLPPSHALPRREFAALDRALAPSPIDRVGLLTGASRTSESDSGVAMAHAQGGLGKTILAAMYARACSTRFGHEDGIFWLTLNQRPSITARQGDLIEMITGKRPEEIPNDDEDGRESLKAVLQVLLRDKSALIVLDDVWDSDHAEWFIVDAPRCRWLLTSRLPILAEHLDLPAQNMVQIDYLSDDEGCLLIKRRIAPGMIDPHPDEALHREISRFFGGHIMGIDIAAARIDPNRATRRFTAQQLLDELQSLKKSGTPFDGVATTIKDEHRQKDVEYSLSLSYLAADPDIQRRFRLLGVFAETGSFDVEAARAVWNDTNSGEAQTAIDELVNLSLLRRNAEEGLAGTRYNLHVTIHMYAGAIGCEGTAFAPATRRHAEYYARLAEDNPGLNSATRLFDEFEQLIMAFEYAREAKNLDLLYSLAWFSADALNLAGRWNQSELWLQQALALHEDSGYSTRISHLIDGLVDLAINKGDWDKAESLLGKAVEIDGQLGHRKAIAVDHVKLGDIAARRGNLNRAEFLLREALQVFEELDDQSLIAKSKAKLAELARKRGDSSEAERLLRESIDTMMTLGDRQQAAEMIGALAIVVEELGDWVAAREMYYAALKVFTEIGHQRGVAIIMGRLADIECSNENYEEAIRLFADAISRLQEMGDEPQVAALRSALAFATAMQGNLTEAEYIIRDTLATLERIGDGYETALAKVRLGRILHMQGLIDDGCAQMKEARTLFLALEFWREAASVEAAIMKSCENDIARVDSKFAPAHLAQLTPKQLSERTHEALSAPLEFREAWCRSLTKHSLDSFRSNDKERADFTRALLHLIEQGEESIDSITLEVPGVYRDAWDALVSHLKGG